MRIGLIDVDGHHFPNLALMKISAWHKAQGDIVEWWATELQYYDVVYMSKVFSNAYTPDAHEPMNCGKVIKGGTGYCITLQDGKEIFRKELNNSLPPEVERMFPDYSIYPQFEYAVSMTSRGCPNQCGFCHVSPKEGCKTVKVADVSDFWNGQSEIKVLDANLTACPDKRVLFRQYRETGAWIDFNQGLDLRRLDEADLEDINAMRIKNIHFAWDLPEIDLEPQLKWYAKRSKHKPHGRNGMVYILTNYNSTKEQDLNRIYTVRDCGYAPYVMVYNKPNAPKEKRMVQRWCNNKRIFGCTQRFEDYLKGEKK